MHLTNNIIAKEGLRKKEADNGNEKTHRIEKEIEKRSTKQPKEIRN